MINRTIISICIALFTAYLVSRKKRRTRLQVVASHGEKVFLVGCSSGIGKALALLYARRGAKLVLVARRKPLLDALVEECLAAGASLAVGMAGDVTQVEDMARIVATSPFQDGIDTVIYCAGAISVRPFMDISGIIISDNKIIQQEEEKVDQAMKDITNINYFAAVHTTRLVLPFLLKSFFQQRQPNLIVISSMAGKVGAPTRSLYSGSKHAVHGFFDSLRVELAPYNIHVGIVCPGTVDTDLRQSAVDLDASTSVIAGSTKGKLSPQVVAERILLASDAREREVYLPGYYYWALWLSRSWIDGFAKRKYRQAS
ncbi:uncharacterized protein BX664DRAFT_343312 [Halteromyces radiatus]|uniref:uncharacterized protein n=1 Tax=Halteromyces radiatus TaxID=101107 RepID=UPI00222009C6|nr:uncharacterized protein BX664DRAFT_343312 [Halteromyces radiatus]KAI8077713.1 hypothetical protein BX664DRAFT_343312 [Halteromyces radiatus]